MKISRALKARVDKGSGKSFAPSTAGFGKGMPFHFHAQSKTCDFSPMHRVSTLNMGVFKMPG
jgi:hypothetical protein